jgi:cobalt-zinc-cadmium efflux system protein
MHAHAHSHGAPATSRPFAIGIGLNVLFTLGEVLYGLPAHSLALLSDDGADLS